MKKFDWRMLLPLTYYRWKRHGDFNGFLFYIDILLYAIILTILDVTIVAVFS
jgi:hypothetical protein